MTSKTIIIGLVAIAFVAGSIMTGTMAEAKPNKDGDGDGNKEGIVHEITGLLNHATFGLETIQNVITSVQSDTTTIKSDVTDIKAETDKITSVNADIGDIKAETDKIPMVKTDIGNLQTDVTMVKSDIADIKTQLGSISEPLTQFENYRLFVEEDDSGSLDIESTGPMEVIICDSDDTIWFINFRGGNIFLAQAHDGQCVPVGVPIGEQLRVIAHTISDQAVGFVSIRTTPSAEITITGHGIIDITD